MPRRQAFPRVVAALVLPFLLLIGTGSARAMFRCEYDRVLREACCCPKAHEAPAVNTVIQASCCDVELVKSGAVSQARAQVDRFEASKLRPAQLAAVVHVAAPAPALVPARAVAVGEHPPDGPPLIVLKRSFLI